MHTCKIVQGLVFTCQFSIHNIKTLLKLFANFQGSGKIVILTLKYRSYKIKCFPTLHNRQFKKKKMLNPVVTLWGRLVGAS